MAIKPFFVSFRVVLTRTLRYDEANAKLNTLRETLRADTTSYLKLSRSCPEPPSDGGSGNMHRYRLCYGLHKLVSRTH